MATTPWGLPLLDGNVQLAPFQGHYNGIANALDSAMSTLRSEVLSGAHMFTGTSAQRTAFTDAANGDHWQDTDGAKNLYRRDGSTWVNLTPNNGTWTTLPLLAGVGGSGQYRISSLGVAEVRIAPTVSVAPNEAIQVAVASVASGLRPTGMTRSLAATTTAFTNAAASISTDGTIRFRNTGNQAGTPLIAGRYTI